MKTRDRIKNAAIEMFNDKGATNVSTVQLSESLKISPGNLYYYFDNKEHLIRSIFTEDIIPNTDMLFFREDFGHSENGILNFFEDYLNKIYQYRFFYAEPYALLKNDPEMLEIYKPRCDKLINQLKTVFDNWIATGIIEEIDQMTKNFIADNIWTVGQTWPNFFRVVAGIEDPVRVNHEGVLHAYAIIAPYLTDAAHDRMLVLLEKKGILEEYDLSDLEK